MVKRFEIGKVTPGDEMDVFRHTLDNADAGDWIIYHVGPHASAPTAMKRAASALSDGGTVMLTQRITGETNSKGERICEYIAVKNGTAAR